MLKKFGINNRNCIKLTPISQSIKVTKHCCKLKGNLKSESRKKESGNDKKSGRHNPGLIFLLKFG
jgi:hypothetical protein